MQIAVAGRGSVPSDRLPEGLFTNTHTHADTYTHTLTHLFTQLKIVPNPPFTRFAHTHAHTRTHTPSQTI